MEHGRRAHPRLFGRRNARRAGPPAVHARGLGGEGRFGVEMRLALNAGRASNERWHLRRDGSRFRASGEIIPLKGDDGAHLGHPRTLRDRTKQQEAREAQRADAEFLCSVLASSGDCINVLDLHARLTFMSEGRAARHGGEQLQRHPRLPLTGFLAGSGQPGRQGRGGSREGRRRRMVPGGGQHDGRHVQVVGRAGSHPSRVRTAGRRGCSPSRAMSPGSSGRRRGGPRCWSWATSCAT